VIAAAITSRQTKAKLPTHIPLYSGTSGLSKDSVVLLEQMRTIDKRRLREKMGSVDEHAMSAIDNAISISLGLVPNGARGALG
jgi:mRNA interferase MazF